MAMSKPRIVLLLLLALTLPGCAGLGSLGITGKAQTARSLNEFRTANGLTPLRTDGHLTALAAAHAASMARRDTLDHSGFMDQRGPAGARAENVAYGCADTPSGIPAWINSAGHRHNMLRNDVTRYGLASARSPSGKTCWALEVGE